MAGPAAADAFSRAWAGHVDALIGYATALARHDDRARAAVGGQLALYAQRLSALLAGLVHNRIPAATVAARAAPEPAFHSVRGVAAVAAPARLEIPAISVRTRLVPLGRKPDGTVEVPSRWEVAGWYSGGARPGAPGASVILGHVDSARYGPAVFFRLHELRPGDAVVVWRQDGSRSTFGVTRVAYFDRSHFPTDDVYYPTVAPELRLVTCGGSFDLAARNYLSNVIAFATLRS